MGILEAGILLAALAVIGIAMMTDNEVKQEKLLFIGIWIIGWLTLFEFSMKLFGFLAGGFR